MEELHVEIRACRACVGAGLLAEATPVATREYAFDDGLSRIGYLGPLGPGRIMLIGQAPGVLEAIDREHFVGRAGRVLFRWLARIGLEEAAFRRHVYVTAVTKCFPGKAVRGGGDRRPSPAELRLCRPFLDRQLAVVDPRLVVLTGKMALDLELPGQPLDALVGQVFEREGLELLPLPHPSGMSRWLNAPANQARLNQALQLLRERINPALLSAPPGGRSRP